MFKILNDKELALIANLTCPQMIELYPFLLIKVIKGSLSYTEVLQNLNIITTNTRARKNIQKFMNENNIKPLNYNKHRTSLTRQERLLLNKEEILKRFVKGDIHYGSQIRKWVISYNLIPYVCSIDGCFLSKLDNIIWNGQELTLDLDHINGDNKDNRLENLRFLCPNCHSQTETYRGRNRRKNTAIPKDKRKRKKNYDNLPDSDTLRNEIENDSVSGIAAKYGVTIYALQKKMDGKLYQELSNFTADRTGKAAYPPVEDMLARVVSEGYESLARELGVSGNAIRKYLKNRLGYVPKRGQNLPEKSE